MVLDIERLVDSVPEGAEALMQKVAETACLKEGVERVIRRWYLYISTS